MGELKVSAGRVNQLKRAGRVITSSEIQIPNSENKLKKRLKSAGRVSTSSHFLVFSFGILITLSAFAFTR